MPVPEDNPITEEKIELGRRLFNDRRLSRDRSIACASCHDPKRAFSDGRPVAIGVDGKLGRRSAPALINRGYGRAFFWDGRAASLEEQVLQPIQDPNEMDMTLAEVSAVWVSAEAELSRALASYVRSILSGNAPIDRFANGDRTALTAEQQAGLQLFRGKGNCTACHVGPTSPTSGFTTRASPGGTAAFRMKDGQRDVARGRPRRVQDADPARDCRTAPYMHDGSLGTLEDVVDFYDRGGNRIPA